MALGKDRTRINVKGGGLFKIEEITSGGVLTSMRDLGFIQSCDFTDVHSMVESVSADGKLLNNQSGGNKPEMSVVLMQTTADEINLLANLQNKLYHVYYQVLLDGPTVRYQEIYAPCCRISQGLTLKFASATMRTLEVKVSILWPKTAVTVTPAGLSVPAGQYYTIAETATTPLGEVTTATGTIYTASA
jgi:hypothetical protein